MTAPLRRLAVLTHSVLPRGGVVHALALADALVDRGHDVTLIAPAEPGQSLFRPTRARTVLLRMPRPAGPLVEQVRQRIDAIATALPAVLHRHRFELLHAQDSLNGNALALLAAGSATLPPWVRTVHHLDDFSAPELAAWQERGWRAAEAIGCVSGLWQQHFADTHGVRAQRLYNGVDLARYTPQGPRHAPAGYVLALGGVEARKNTPRLLEAYARWRGRDPQAAGLRLLVAGGASLLDHEAAHRDWQQTLARHGLHDGPGGAVERRGPVDDAAVPALLRGAAAVAMPSLNEGFGLVALEALACGTPVLVSDRPPFTEHLRGSPGVAWCEPTDLASIEAGLAAVLRLPRLDAPPPVCLQHDWARSAAVHEAWYAEVLARRLARAPDPLAA